tara:strand:- start:58833 stop:59480 length:648 start_codon:yes stop_codon:yes gene_type:complete
MSKVLHLLYAAIRRFGILDVTKLLHLPTTDCDITVCPTGYEIRGAHPSELAELIRSGNAPAELGQPERVDPASRTAILTFYQGRVVSFLWLAKETVQGAENFSRAAHLGTSIEMPDGTGFVYNAWTDPEHRGKRLIAAMLTWATCNRVMGTTSFLTMIDWTNLRSIRAFEHLGMQTLGSIYRFGRGRLQMSMIPSSAHRMGLRLATDAPGIKWTR